MADTQPRLMRRLARLASRLERLSQAVRQSLARELEKCRSSALLATAPDSDRLAVELHDTEMLIEQHARRGIPLA